MRLLYGLSDHQSSNVRKVCRSTDSIGQTLNALSYELSELTKRYLTAVYTAYQVKRNTALTFLQRQFHRQANKLAFSARRSMSFVPPMCTLR